VERELINESQRDDHAGDVGSLVARIADHLQHGAAVVRFETGLVVSGSLIAQRVVHVDEHLARLVVFRIHEIQLAGEVFRDLCARIRFMGEVQQFEAVGIVVAGGPHLDTPAAAGDLNVLRGGERIGDQPGAQ